VTYCQVLGSTEFNLKGGLSPKKTQKTYSPVLHSLKVLMQLCTCGIYRQLNSILQPGNHIPKSSKM